MDGGTENASTWRSAIGWGLTLWRKTNAVPTCLFTEGITRTSEQPIGAGGFGAVYKGKAPGSLPVALKVITAHRISDPRSARAIQVGVLYRLTM